MPLYNYHCTACRHDFEALHNINAEASEIECPKCKTRGSCEKRVAVPGRAKVRGGTGASKKAW